MLEAGLDSFACFACCQELCPFEFLRPSGSQNFAERKKEPWREQ